MAGFLFSELLLQEKEHILGRAPLISEKNQIAISFIIETILKKS